MFTSDKKHKERMSTPTLGVLALVGVIVCGSLQADDVPSLGEPVSEQQIAEVDYSVLPGGEGLPGGSGNALRGKAVYADNCLACHGEKGQDGINDRLAGGLGTLQSDSPVKTVGSFWPYSTTLFDYIRRAMPYQTPGSLSNDDVYAATAYILYLNGIVAENDELDANTLPQVRMPNRDGFVWDYRPQ